MNRGDLVAMCREFSFTEVCDIFNNTYLEGKRHWQQFRHELPQMDLAWLRVAPDKAIDATICRPLHDYVTQNAPELITSFKAPINPDDGWRMWAVKHGFNYGIGIVSQYAHMAVDPLYTVFNDILKKTPSATFNALNPAQLLILGSNYPQVQRYFAQRFDQVSKPYQYYLDFRGEVRNALMGTPTSFAITKHHYAHSQGVKHLGYTVIDLAEESIAEKIGVAMAIFGVYHFPKSVRTATNASFDKLFPKNTAFGFTARSLPFRFIFSKPVARIHGNPILSVGVLTFLAAMSVAKSIQDSLTLETKRPDLFKLLQSQGKTGRELAKASWHCSFMDSSDNTKS